MFSHSLPRLRLRKEALAKAKADLAPGIALMKKEPSMRSLPTYDRFGDVHDFLRVR